MVVGVQSVTVVDSRRLEEEDCVVVVIRHRPVWIAEEDLL
jgi:hypothetical protein